MYGRTLTRPAATATDKWGNWGQVGVYNQIQGRGDTTWYRSPGWVEVFNSTQDLEIGKDGQRPFVFFGTMTEDVYSVHLGDGFFKPGHQVLSVDGMDK